MALLLSKEVKVNSKGGTSNAYKFKLEVIENSTNIDNNTSNVTINLWAAHNLSSTGGYKQYSSPKASLFVDSIEKTNVTVSEIYGTTYKIISAWTGDITHNDDGSKNIYVYATFNPNSNTSYLPSSMNVDGAVSLTTIPRTSTFSATDAEIEGISKITINRNSNFTYNLLYSFKNLTGTIATGVTSNYDWTIPTSFYEQIPSSKSATCTITCITYSGNTQIGSTSSTITVSCNEAINAPIISSYSIKDINQATKNLTGNDNVLVKYRSNVKITVNSSAKNGASISSVKVDGQSIDSSNSITFNNVDRNYFIVTLIDSRGFSKTIPITASYVDYVILTCQAKPKRTSQTSSTITLEYSGNYYNGSFGNTYNTLNMSWKYRQKGSTSWTNGGTLTPTISNNTYSGSKTLGTNFNYKKDYEFMISYSDKIDSQNTTISTSKGQGNFEIYDKALLANGDVLFRWDSGSIQVGDWLNSLKSTLMNSIYPVGAVYISLSSTNPSTLFGGTWQQIKGRFLLGVGEQDDNNSYRYGDSISKVDVPVGEKGGGDLVELTIAEMPKHNHTSNPHGHGRLKWWGGNTASLNSGGNSYRWNWDTTGKNDDGFTMDEATVSINNTGEGVAHNNMPPYLGVYMWKRTA